MFKKLNIRHKQDSDQISKDEISIVRDEKYTGWHEDRLNITDEKINEFEDIAIKPILNQTCKEK